MEAVCSLKQIYQPTDFLNCFICQEEKSDRLIKAGVQGLEALKCASQKRDKLCDRDNKDTIDRINNVPMKDVEQLRWHKSCFSLFTSKTLIERLQQKRQISRQQISESSTSNTMLRSSTASVKWDLCIFCQDTKPKETLSSVTTFKMSDQILEFSKYDQEAHLRLAGISDLIAAEGKYYANCYKKFKRNATKTKDGAEKK